MTVEREQPLDFEECSGAVAATQWPLQPGPIAMYQYAVVHFL